MRFDYDPDSDCLYVQVSDRAPISRTREYGNGVLLDLDEDAQVVGVELLFVNGDAHIREAT